MKIAESREADDMTGRQILHYKIMRRIGEGGRGELYKALDLKLGRFVAVKFLLPGLSSEHEARSALISEAKTASALSHPNICRTYDIVETDEYLFIVMEYLEGRTLREMIGRLNMEQILDISIQAARGLGAAHTRGIVHGDIKPENLIMQPDGLIRITDFGVAFFVNSSEELHLHDSGLLTGSFPYMSPEQIQGWNVDSRSDIFSLGAVIYELLTREPPFKGIHRAAIEYEIVHVEPASLNADHSGFEGELMEIIRECLKKKRDE